MIKSVYIHIPFCDTICSYCDFCKYIKNSKWIDFYLNELECEIKSKYKGEVIETLYIGGGTPSSLNLDELKKLFRIIKIFNLDKNIEFTFECNIESLDYDKLKFLYENNVNRHHNEDMIKDKISMIKSIGFTNINIDLMYGYKNQKLNDLNEDLNKFLSLNIPHISTYSLILEPNISE